MMTTKTDAVDTVHCALCTDKREVTQIVKFVFTIHTIYRYIDIYIQYIDIYIQYIDI